MGHSVLTFNLGNLKNSGTFFSNSVPFLQYLNFKNAKNANFEIPISKQNLEDLISYAMSLSNIETQTFNCIVKLFKKQNSKYILAKLEI